MDKCQGQNRRTEMLFCAPGSALVYMIHRGKWSEALIRGTGTSTSVRGCLHLDPWKHKSYIRLSAYVRLKIFAATYTSDDKFLLSTNAGLSIPRFEPKWL